MENMDFDALLFLALTMMAFSIKPGPGMLAVASRALSDRGMLAVAAFMAGNNLAKLIFLLIVVLGYSAIDDYKLSVIILAKALAAVYLVYLGVKGFNTQVQTEYGQDEIKSASRTKSLLEDFSVGFFITITNPYDIIFFAGMVPTIISIELIGFVEYWVIFFVMLVADLPVVLSYTLPLRFGRNFFKGDKMRYFDYGANAILILAGLIIGYSALMSGQILPNL